MEIEKLIFYILKYYTKDHLFIKVILFSFLTDLQQFVIAIGLLIHNPDYAM